jgi:hypothetical protein
MFGPRRVKNMKSTGIGRVPVVILSIEVPRIGVITDITTSTSQKALIQYSIKQEND